jgi:hypothetical protein
MKINNKYVKLFLVAAVFTFGSCETIDLDQTDNPSTISADQLDPVYAFNYVQLQLPDFIDSANSFTQRVTRQMAMTGGNTYENAFAPVNSNNNWSIAYNILNAVKLMEPKAQQNNQTYILGATKVIRCYVLMTLCDMYGDIPVTEALLGNQNLTPKYDKSADVYKQILRELDEAIVTLNTPGATLPEKFTDLYYKGPSSWVTLANTLKLKMYNNARMAGSEIGVDIGAAMTAIVTGGDYIDRAERDFYFKYGNNRVLPNTRHPLYNDQYELGGGAYIGNYMMYSMTTEKYTSASPVDDSTVFPTTPTGIATLLNSNYDPRIHFYFFKQVASLPASDEFTLPKGIRPDHYNDSQYDSFFNPGIHTSYLVSNWVFNTFPTTGFLGRDHGNNDGIPPDASYRTVAGLYPIGGSYGPADDVQKSGIRGALGAGIMPMVMSSYVQFMLAEASLEVDNFTGDARAYFRAGMEQSIDKVIGFIPTYQPASRPSVSDLQTQRTNYLNFMMGKYDEQGSDARRLELIMKEFYIASWGNGIEPYNNYRRTGYPSNFQPTREPVSGAFYYTALYAGSSVNNNPNTPTNSRTRKVFWDKANLNLH